MWDLGTLKEVVPILMQTRRLVGESIEAKHLLVIGDKVWVWVI